MSAPESRLRARIEALEIENEALRQALLDDGFDFPGMKLRPVGRLLLSVLMKSQSVTPRRVNAILEAARPSEAGREPNADKQVVKNLRKSLAPYGVEITTRWGSGYCLLPEAKERLRSLAQG
jgi:DNA-binding response OmpR family regulator